jgi:hypothetical protein
MSYGFNDGRWMKLVHDRTQWRSLELAVPNFGFYYERDNYRILCCTTRITIPPHLHHKPAV